MQRIIKTTDISLAVDISKAMKLEYILWKVNEYGEIISILGCPSGKLAYISRWENQNVLKDNLILILITKDILSKFEEMLKLQLKEVVYEDDIIIPIGFEHNAIGINKYLTIQYFVYTDIISKILENELFVYNYINGNQPISMNDYGLISDNETLLNNLSNKTSDGCMMFKMDQYMMFIHKGFIPINKADKVYLTIYNKLYDTSSFLAMYSIAKKKTIRIDFFFYCVNLV